MYGSSSHVEQEKGCPYQALATPQLSDWRPGLSQSWSTKEAAFCETKLVAVYQKIFLLNIHRRKLNQYSYIRNLCLNKHSRRRHSNSISSPRCRIAFGSDHIQAKCTSRLSMGSCCSIVLLFDSHAAWCLKWLILLQSFCCQFQKNQAFYHLRHRFLRRKCMKQIACKWSSVPLSLANAGTAWFSNAVGSTGWADSVRLKQYCHDGGAIPLATTNQVPSGFLYPAFRAQ